MRAGAVHEDAAGRLKQSAMWSLAVALSQQSPVDETALASITQHIAPFESRVHQEAVLALVAFVARAVDRERQAERFVRTAIDGFRFQFKLARPGSHTAQRSLVLF